jgi:hypothetical protein
MRLEHLIPVPNHHLVGTRQGVMIVLWTIREHGPLSFARLYELVYGTERLGPSQLNFISEALGHLAHAGLIAFDGIADPSQLRAMGRQVPSLPSDISFQVTPAVDAVQNLFGISVTAYARAGFDQIAVDPVFGQPQRWRSVGWPDAFVLMPLAVDLKAVYEDHILKVANGLGIRCERADDFFSSGAIIAEVWSAIYHAKVCIADCTDRNPNVFYEIGIAHTLGRPCILIAQSIADIPFDLRHRRVIVYSFTPRGMQEFEEALAKALSHDLESPA